MADNKELEKTITGVDDKDAIKETTGSSVEIYDEYDEDEIEETKKPKKKIKKKWIVLGAVVLLVGFFVVRGITASKNKVTMVETVDVAKGSIENILSVSGTVESAETKSYFADVTAPIEKLNVKMGDKVANGDVLYTYNEKELNLAEQQAQLDIKQAKGSYNALFTESAAADRKYAEGMNAQQINERIDAITAEINALNDKITEKTNRMSKTLTDLQKTMQDIDQDGEMDQYGDGDFADRKEHDDDDNSRQMALAVQESYLEVQNSLKNDTEIQGWQRQIENLKEEQTHLSTAKASEVNGGQVQANKAALDKQQITQGDVIAKIKAAKEGVKADFNGVVTEVEVVEGATVASGTKMVTLANLDDVQVSVQVSKTDLPKISLGQKVDITINGKAYTGEITQISGSATKNANGVAVVDTKIKVTNPDNEIILGVEANNKIHAEKADNTIVLPYEYVLTDAEGDYVFVLENGTAVRKAVKIGISTSTDAQIVEGLSENDKVITTNLDTLTDGMPVATMEAKNE